MDRPGRAEMLIAIRKGRHGSVGGVSFSSPDDMLEAFDASSGNLIWRATKPNGLFGEVPPLFEALRAEVAKAHVAPKKP